jgi:hypothetical protein
MSVFVKNIVATTRQAPATNHAQPPRPRTLCNNLLDTSTDVLGRDGHFRHTKPIPLLLASRA